MKIETGTLLSIANLLPLHAHHCRWAVCLKNVLTTASALCCPSFILLSLDLFFCPLPDGHATLSLLLVPSCPTPGAGPTPGCSSFRSVSHPSHEAGQNMSNPGLSGVVQGSGMFMILSRSRTRHTRAETQGQTLAHCLTAPPAPLLAFFS